MSRIPMVLLAAITFFAIVLGFPSSLLAETPAGEVRQVTSDARGNKVADAVVLEFGAGVSVEHVLRAYGPDYQRATGEPLTWEILQAANPNTTIPVCFAPQNGRKYIGRGDTSIWDTCPDEKKGIGLIAGHSGRIVIPSAHVETYASKMKRLEELEACVKDADCLTQKLSALGGSASTSSTSKQTPSQPPTEDGRVAQLTQQLEAKDRQIASMTRELEAERAIVASLRNPAKGQETTNGASVAPTSGHRQMPLWPWSLVIAGMVTLAFAVGQTRGKKTRSVMRPPPDGDVLKKLPEGDPEERTEYKVRPIPAPIALAPTVPAPQAVSISNTPADIKRDITDLEARIRLLTGSPTSHAVRMALDKEIRSLYALLKSTIPDLEPPVAIDSSSRATVPEITLTPKTESLSAWRGRKESYEREIAKRDGEIAAVKWLKNQASHETRDAEEKLSAAIDKSVSLLAWKTRMIRDVLPRARRHREWLWGLLANARDRATKLSEENARLVQENEQARAKLKSMTEEAVRRGEYGVRHKNALKKALRIGRSLKERTVDQERLRTNFASAWRTYIGYSTALTRARSDPSRSGEVSRLIHEKTHAFEQVQECFRGLTDGVEVLELLHELQLSARPPAASSSNGVRKDTDKGMSPPIPPTNGNGAANGDVDSHISNKLISDKWLAGASRLTKPDTFILTRGLVGYFTEILQMPAQLAEEFTAHQTREAQDELSKPKPLLEAVQWAYGMLAGVGMPFEKKTLPPPPAGL